MFASTYPAPSRQSQRGRSLVETLVSTTLGMLTLVLSTSSVLALVVNESATGSARALASSVEFARGEAARLRRPVGLCGLSVKSANKPAGEVSCEESANEWRAGWIVFEDGNRNGRLDDGEGVLQVSRRQNLSVQPQLAATATGAVAPTGAAAESDSSTSAAISFQPIGTLAQATPVAMQVGAQGERVQSVCIAIDGHVSVLQSGKSCR